MTVTSHDHSNRKTIDIGDGLVMRWSTKADTDNVVDLISNSFRWLALGDPLPEDSIPGPNEFMIAATRRLLCGKNACMSEFDYALVEDTRREKGKNPIIACASLHQCLMYYGSVSFNVGKPELIATDPEYRNKGLIRRLLNEMLHPESEGRGHVFQFIPGIQHFYRQFGYEYGIGCDAPGTIESSNFVPALGKDKSEPYILRVATQDDLPFLNRLSSPERLHHHSAMGVRYTPEYWQWTVHDMYCLDKKTRFDNFRDTRIIVEAESDKPVGFTVVSYVFLAPMLEALALENDVDYVRTFHSTLRQLLAQSNEHLQLAVKEREAAKNQDLSTSDNGTTGNTGPHPIPLKFNVVLHERHPFSLLLGKNMVRRPNIPGYRFYTRIHSYPAFIKAVTPELESRLANSALAGVTGRLRLDFFRQVEGSSGKGLEIQFEDGKIVEAKDWATSSPEKQLEEKLAWKKAGNTPTIYYATFAPLTFTPLLTGRCSLEELHWAYGENSVRDDDSRLLLNTLFPKGHHRFDIFYW
ncbi:hypothetical protein B0O80DRAFT_439220 [Mortierella sp. GBAus27b]|nr:hypothetical protein BGX31_006679 [Mortierella sp. GBA43]KAI8360389.1 hypothetical protein B0O80DRAFT_439220 [Mortierella sp. GBAus27b]